VTVTAFSSGLTPRAETRSVTVEQAAAGQLVLLIEARNGDSWLRIVTDGTRERDWGGPTLRAGQSATVSANEEIFLRAGNAGVLRITLNGEALGRLGRPGEVGNWIIRPGALPERTTEQR
jgi:hypothetical protein